MGSSLTEDMRFRKSKFTLRCAAAVRVVASVGVVSLFMLGCQRSATAPTPGSYSIQGTLALDGGGDPSQATVRLFAAPQDAMISQTLNDHPSLGFSPIYLSLFDPLTQSPLNSLNPEQSGYFHFPNLAAETYILDAVLEGYACAEPLLAVISTDADVGTLWLSPEEYVSGNLGQAIWDSGKVYRLSGDILILPEALLTIQQNVLILLDGDYTMTVAGGIQITASPQNPVRFRLSEEHFQVGGDWGGIRIDHPTNDCVLTGMVIQGAFTALQVSAGEAQVSECLFDAPGAYGAYFSANASGTVMNSIVRDGNNGLVADNSDPQFSQNLILRTSETGVIVKSYSQATLQENALLDCETGIWSDWYTSPLIQHNLISGGSRAIEAQTGFTATVRYNVFQGQESEGIYLYNCYPLIENNNFINMPLNILHVNGNNGQQSDTVFAVYNYWDGEDATGIPQRIVDGHDIGSPNNPVGPVEYEPFLLTPVAEAGP